MRARSAGDCMTAPSCATRAYWKARSGDAQRREETGDGKLETGNGKRRLEPPAEKHLSRSKEKGRSRAPFRVSRFRQSLSDLLVRRSSVTHIFPSFSM